MCCTCVAQGNPWVVHAASCPLWEPCTNPECRHGLDHRGACDEDERRD